MQGIDRVSHEAICQWIWRGKVHKSALLVITDRATLITRVKKVTSRQADHTEVVIEQMLVRVPKSFIKTLTTDNDKGFSNHPSSARKLDADVYFILPYTSRDKGTVENRIRVIRQFFPTGTDLREVSEERIKTAERHLNNRPIRKFDYLSPI